jgi:hypothetical protein
VTRVGVTGHRGLPPDTAQLVREQIDRVLPAHDPRGLVGVSCLADGADQIFADAVLRAGGSLEVVVPAREYRDRLPPDSHAEYDRLLAKAAAVHRLDYDDSNAEAHMAASAALVDMVDHLIAVWDGQPARSYGGTADVVAYATEHAVPVTQVWPRGARRD